VVIVGFFDDGKDIGETVSHFGHTLGGIEELNNWPTRLSVALCFGNPQTVKTIRDKITNNNIIFPNLIDPSFSIADTLTFTYRRGQHYQRPLQRDHKCHDWQLQPS